MLISAPNSPASQIKIPKEKVQQLMDVVAWLDGIFSGDIAAIKQIRGLIETGAAPLTVMSAEDMKNFLKAICDAAGVYPTSKEA